MKYINLLSFLFLCSLPVHASYTGRVFVDKNNNGKFDKGERSLKGVNVSDGLHVVKTMADGTFVLSGHDRERFIFITTPSGYKTMNCHYYKIIDGQATYDFALLPYDAGLSDNGAHRYVHVSDTEIFNTTDHDDWVGVIRRYAANEKAAFIIHTGDICYEKGLKEHLKLMSTSTMNCPVFYGIGNHDLVKGKYGEELFESIYGPVYYSFDVGNMHYIVTPMLGGDHLPGYTSEDVYRWLKNDLAQIKPNTPIMVFNHDLLTYGDQFIYKGKSGSINLNEYNLKAWVYGHWHINHMKKQGSVYSVCTTALDKGGIDHSTSAFRVMHVDKNGDFRSELRYSYIDKHICIASPTDNCATDGIFVNVYHSASPTKAVTYSCLLDGKQVVSNKALCQSTDWTWTSKLSLSPKYKGKEMLLRVNALFYNGETVSTEKKFTNKPTQEALVNMAQDWTNLLENSQHAAPNVGDLRPPLQLVWAKNIGSNIYMTSPLVYKGNIYVASMDENLLGKASVCALDGNSGTILWRFPLRGSVKNTIAIEDGLVFAQDIYGSLYAIETETGKLRWESNLPVNGLPGLVEGLVVDSGSVYAGTGKSLSAIDAATGQLIWRNEAWSQREGTTSTLTQGNGVLIGSVQWTALYGNDSKTGKMLWSASENGLRNRGASASMHGTLLYLVSEKSFFILDAKTGKVIVRKPLKYNVDVTSTPLLTDNEIIFGSADHGLIALDRETLEEKWTTPVGDALIYTSPYSRKRSTTIETSPVISGKTIYVGASDGVLYGINKENGEKVWTYATGSPILASLAISGNTLIAVDFGGNVYLFSGEKK